MAAVSDVNASGDPYVDGLLSGVKWAGDSLTFSFPTKASFYEPGYGLGEPKTGFEALNATQQSVVRASFTMYAQIANLQFVEVTESSTVHGDLRQAMSDVPDTAWTYYPGTTPESGDSWFNNASGKFDSPVKGNYAYATFVHEIGHALGLEHPQEGSAMPIERDSLEYTVMSYRSYVGATLDSGYNNEKWGYPQSPMMYDIAALHYMYGPNYATNSGDTTYAWSPTTGEMFIDGVGQGAPGGNRIFLTVWDGGGIDTYDFSNYASDLHVDLRPGRWTTTSAAQLAKLHWDGSQLAAGNIANALLFSGDTRSLIENARGGSGHDVLVGNAGANTLWGGDGNDGLNGLAGDDTLFGGPGDDIFVGGPGGDHFDGGSGMDRVSYRYVPATDAGTGNGLIVDLEHAHLNTGQASGDTYASVERVVGSLFDDSLRGDGAANILWGLDGHDLLVGRGGDDRLFGGPGHDIFVGGPGGDHFDGGSGVDRVSYRSAPATDAGTGAGLVADLEHANLNTGEAGGDTYASIERVVGSLFDDSLRGDGADNILWGLDGNDLLIGRGGNDSLFGGDGNDIFVGGPGGDHLDGGSGVDRVSYRSAPATDAGTGAGLIIDLQHPTLNTGEATGDTYASIERVVGSDFSDSLRGDAADNFLWGLDGHDTLAGRGGNDRLFGGDGDDVLVGGSGVDVLYGQEGADSFVFNTVDDSQPGAADTIQDFTSGSDIISLQLIDADTTLGGDQAFTYIGGSAFSSTAGELNFLNELLSGDVDGDGTADLQILVAGVASLNESDFLL